MSFSDRFVAGEEKILVYEGPEEIGEVVRVVSPSLRFLSKSGTR